MEDQILKFIGEVVAISGGAAVIFIGILKVFGQKWLDKHFKKEIEKYKHELNSLFNRIVKVQEKEFEILPESWNKLQKAWGNISFLTSPLQSYPDLNKLEYSDLVNFVKNCELEEYQKAEVLKIENKTQYYIEKIFWIRFNDTQKSITEFRNYIMLNKIFFEKNLYDLFKDLDNKFFGIMLDTRDINSDKVDFKYTSEVRSEINNVKNNIKPLINKTEDLIQARLHFNDVK